MSPAKVAERPAEMVLTAQERAAQAWDDAEEFMADAYGERVWDIQPRRSGGAR